MNIKKIGIGIILLLGIYFGYQQYKNQQNIKVDSIENLENVKICSDGNCDTNGTVCSDGTTCCSGNCNAGVCEACYKFGGPCSSDGQCCASNCAYSICGGNLGLELTAIQVAAEQLGATIEEAIDKYLTKNPEAEEEYEEFEAEYGAEIATDEEVALETAETAVADVTPESGEVVFGLEDAAGMGIGEEIVVDVAVVGAAAE